MGCIIISYSTPPRYYTMSSSSTSIVLSAVDEWDTSSIQYMQPKVNKQGGKAITVISKQTRRGLQISTPPMTSWGISDFVDPETQQSDGKYMLSLAFPLTEYSTPATEKFLEQMKAFENQIIEDAVSNSVLWWGKKMSRELVEFSYFSFLKYPKKKDVNGKTTDETDTSRPPSIRAKVPLWEGAWKVEIYNPKKEKLFPCDNENLTPIDFVPSKSKVACNLQCGGIWIGGKGWGLTWKLTQCVVKPPEVVSVFGKCNVKISDTDFAAIDNQQVDGNVHEDDSETTEQPSAPAPAPAPTPTPVSTQVEDSDDEQEPDTETVEETETEPELAVVAEPVKEEAPKKKVIKKAAVPEAVADATPVVKKKVVKKA